MNSESPFAEETYVFERMWPTLQQPWYFDSPRGMSVDKNGYVYIADIYFSRIQKFSSEGKFITKWGRLGSEDGEFSLPTATTVDSNNNIYVVDAGNNRIQKFNSNGQYITSWGGRYEYDNFDCSNSRAIKVDQNDDIYVVISSGIQKFSNDGILKMNIPLDFYTAFISYLEIDQYGNIYVSNYGFIRKINTKGEILVEWGDSGTNERQINDINGVTLDKNDNLYVSDSEFIYKFTLDGTFLEKWESSKPVESLSLNSEEFLYKKGDKANSINQYNSNGELINIWGHSINEFDPVYPYHITVDIKDNIYINGYSYEIKIYDKYGQFIKQIDYPITQEFANMVVDSKGNIFTNDLSRSYVYKISPDGKLIKQWGQEWGTGWAQCMTIDKNDIIYIVDNNRIRKFNTEGDYISEIVNNEINGGRGLVIDKDGNFYLINGMGYIEKFANDGKFITEWYYGDWSSFVATGAGWIAIDSNDNIYIVGDNKISKYNTNGLLLSSFGEYGSDIGYFNYLEGIVIGADDNIYICDRENNRIQVFKNLNLTTKIKSIIVAGGGSYPGNSLWVTTQMAANFAYRTLTYQGFIKDTIYYLTSDTDLDLDSNGVLDDVDGDTTNANLEYAIKEWAKDADELVIYLTDHGGDGSFRMSGTETLSASDLDTWLDDIQKTIPGKVIVVYDACESGSFISQLTPPEGKQRIVMSSTSPEEPANFLTQGTVSFSNFFWTHIFNGFDIYNAFSLAKEAMESPTEYQHPLLDANGNGTANEPEDLDAVKNIYIGNGTKIHGDMPQITSVSEPQTITNTNQALLSASNVTDNDGIVRVWAVIRPPEYLQWDSDNPIQEYPSLDLKPTGDNQWEAEYGGFSIQGTYRIAIYAMDRIGNTSIPKLTTVSVENPLRRRAIVVTGGTESDPGFETVRPIIENNGRLIHESLTFQGYSNDDMYILSPVTISDGTDGSPTLSNLQFAITQWAKENTQDVVIHLLGNGDTGAFKINDSETLTAAKLDEWMDMLQTANPSIMITLIYDAPKAGSFLETLKPEGEQKRILLASSANNQPAYFLANGHISFSQYFWRRVLNGSKVLDAFLNAKSALTASCRDQVPQIDDNGNGIGNEKSDGRTARNFTIGAGIILAGDDPIIGTISPEQILNGESSAVIRAENVTTTGTIEEVWAVITPSDFNSDSSDAMVTQLPVISLKKIDTDTYEGSYDLFVKQGTYEISVFAKDVQDNISMPTVTQVIQTVNVPVEDNKGDINGDGRVDLIDAVTILKIIAGFSNYGYIRPDYESSDVDVDGNSFIGFPELIYILQKISIK